MNSIQLRIDKMDWNLLRVFEVVFRERHITRAADVLALTPSAVSHALRRLREHLADPLFIREGTVMMPTPACQRLAPGLLEHMARLRQLLQQWTQFDAATTRQTFRLGVPEAVEMALLPTIATSIQERAPGATLASVSYDRANISRLLASGQIDAVIDVAQPVRAPVRHHALLQDSFSIVAGRLLPWKRSPTLAQYLASRHVAVSGRSTGTVLEDATLLAQGVQRQIALRCQNYTSAFRIVSMSDYILTAPTRLSDEVSSALELRQWKLPFDMPEVRLHLYWHENNEADGASQWLRQSIIASVRSRFGKGGIR